MAGALGMFATTLEHVFVRRAFHMAIHRVFESVHDLSEGFSKAQEEGQSFGQSIAEAIEKARGLQTVSEQAQELRKSLHEVAEAADQARMSLRDFYREREHGTIDILGQDVDLGFKGTNDEKIAQVKKLQKEISDKLTENDTARKAARTRIEQDERAARELDPSGAFPGLSMAARQDAEQARKKLADLEHARRELQTNAAGVDKELHKLEGTNRPVDRATSFETADQLYDRIAQTASQDFLGPEAKDPVVAAINENTEATKEVRDAIKQNHGALP